MCYTRPYLYLYLYGYKQVELNDPDSGTATLEGAFHLIVGTIYVKIESSRFPSTSVAQAWQIRNDNSDAGYFYFYFNFYFNF